MKIVLLENQVELLLKSLQNYSKVDKEKMQLIYLTYESLLAQLQENKGIGKRNKNVIINFIKKIDNQKIV